MNLRKTIAAVLILLVLLAVCAAAGAETKVVGITDPAYGKVILNYRLDDETKTAAVAKTINNRAPEEYTIPETVTHEGIQYTVTEIADEAFYNYISFRKITIPSTMTRIGEKAFYGNQYLTAVAFAPNSQLTEIGNCAFLGTNNLTSFGPFPESLTTIGEAAFDGSAISGDNGTLTIPAGVTGIGTDAFVECLNLKAFSVDPRNTAYKSVDGIIFSKDGTVLVCAPRRKEYAGGKYIVPDGVTKISDRALYRGLLQDDEPEQEEYLLLPPSV